MTDTNVTLKVVDSAASPAFQNLKNLEQSVEAISELANAISGTELHNLLTILSERLTGAFERVYVDTLQNLDS